MVSMDLTQGDIKKHIRTLAIPASIGFFFHTMFNVTDTYFAGLISTQALAALSISFPIFFMIIAFAGGMSEAVTAVIGNALGEGKRDSVCRIVTNAFIVGLGLATLLTLSGYFVAPLLMGWLGAEGSYLNEAREYIHVIVLGALLFVFTFFINAMLNAIGDTVSFRNVLMVSALLNIVLDYWFVEGGLGMPALGVRGIALATVIIEALSVGYLWYRFSKTLLSENLQWSHYDRKIVRELLRQGIPPSMNMILTAVGIYIITFFALPYGQDVVAAYGVGMRIEQIVLMPAIGLNVAVLAIVAQNNGTGAYDRIEETVSLALSYGMALAMIGGVVLLLASDSVMKIFSSSPGVITEGVTYLRIEAFLIYPFMVIFIYLAMLQGIKRPGFILYISVARQIVFPVMVLGGLAWLSLSVLSVWLGIAAVVGASAVVTRWYAGRVFAELKGTLQKNL